MSTLSAYERARRAFYDNRDRQPRVIVFVPTDHETYWEALGAVPPRRHKGSAFLMGEPHHDEPWGTIWTMFYEFPGGNYGCAFVTVREFDDLLDNQRNGLRAVGDMLKMFHPTAEIVTTLRGPVNVRV